MNALCFMRDETVDKCFNFGQTLQPTPLFVFFCLTHFRVAPHILKTVSINLILHVTFQNKFTAILLFYCTHWRDVSVYSNKLYIWYG